MRPIYEWISKNINREAVKRCWKVIVQYAGVIAAFLVACALSIYEWIRKRVTMKTILKHRRVIALFMCVMTVLWTGYALILPAITISVEEAREMGGIDIGPAEEEAVAAAEEEAAAENEINEEFDVDQREETAEETAQTAEPAEETVEEAAQIADPADEAAGSEDAADVPADEEQQDILAEEAVQADAVVEPEEAAPLTGSVYAHSLNIRAEKSLEAEILGILEDTEIVTILEDTEEIVDDNGQAVEDGWLYIRKNDGTEGYVKSEYVILENETVEEKRLAADFAETVGAVSVSVEAPVGAFPKGTTMTVKAVAQEEVMDAVQSVVEENIKTVSAVDITFTDPMGDEIEPYGEIKVSMSSAEMVETEEPVVVHVDDEGAAAVVESQKEEEQVVFTADSFSVYVIVGTELVTEFTISNPDGEDVTYLVTVTYGPEANIPVGSTLKVTPFDEESAEYEYARNAVLVDKKEKGEFVDITDFNLAALDISIIDPDGEEIEPEAAVTVDMRIKSLPEVEDLNEVKDTLEIQHHVEVEDGVVIEKVFDGSVEGSYEMDTDENIAKKGLVVDPESFDEEDYFTSEKEETLDTSFETKVFSTFTITWRGGYGNPQRTVTVHYIDESGNELTISNPDYTHGNLNALSSSPAFLIYDIDGYEYSYTYRNTSTNRIAPLLTKNESNYWRYSSNLSGDYAGWTEMSDGDNIYVVYKQKTEPSTGGTAVIETEEEWPEGEDAPQFSKSSVNNGNGTNTITLSIAAGEKPVEENMPADVIVIFDRSGSMQEYNLGDDSRLQAAKSATNQMANTLFTSNSNVRMALISFSNTAQVEQGFTDNYTTFSGKVNNLTSDGGTNWEKALELANQMDVREDAATFVVFVTDGDPTFRDSRGDFTNGNIDHQSGYDYRYVRQYNVFGDGLTDDTGRNFDFAVDQVSAISGKNKNFYAIGISEDVTKIQNLITQGGVAEDHAFIVSDKDAMDAAFKSITESIKVALGFGNVEITDGITELTHAEMKVMETVDPNSFTYYRWGGENNKYGPDETHMTEWTTREADGCAPATYDNDSGAVHWNMGEGFQLEDGVHYVVTFRVWPSQESYDLIADLNNGVKVYAPGSPNSITDAERAQVVEIAAPTADSQGNYALKTNTDEVNATYNKTTKTGDTVTISDTHDIDATYHKGTIEDMALESMPLTIKKVFEDDLTGGEDRETEVVLVMKRRNAHQTPEEEFADYAVPQGGTTSANIVLNEANDWTYKLYVAPGFEVDGEVLEHGYDFTITEPGIDYHYGLIKEIINPMVVDGEDTYYGDGELLDGEAIQDYTDHSLTAVNRVKSGIDIKKILYDVDGTTEIFPETEFTITGKLLGPDGQPFIWHDGDDVDASGAYHKYDKDGNRIIYKGHFEDSGNIIFTLKAGESVRFINVPDGCTFEYTESTDGMDALGYEWVSTEAITQHRTEAEGPFTPEGDVQPDASGQTASLKDGKSVVGNKQYAITYSNKRTIPLPEIELVKVDASDASMKLNDVEFSLHKDSVDGELVRVDGNGNEIDIKTGNKEGSAGPDGWYHIGLLPAGTYYLVETTEPAGYVHDSTPVIITVTKGDTNYSVTATKDGESILTGPVDGLYTLTVDNEKAKKYVKVFKYETGTNPEKALQGAVFTLTGPDGTTTEDLTTNSEGYLVFADSKTYVELPVDKSAYTLFEKEAPAGYKKIIETVNFTVTTEGVSATGSGYDIISSTETIDGKEVTVYTIKVQNSAGAELPMTGGSGTQFYTLSGIVLIVAAALMYGFRMRRRERGFN